MAHANLKNMFESGASGKVVLKLKSGAIKIGGGTYNSFKPSLVSISGDINWDGKWAGQKIIDPIHGNFEFSIDILNDSKCRLLFRILVNGVQLYSIDDDYPYEMRGSRKMIIHSINTVINGQHVTGDITIADAHDHATKYNPDFPLKKVNGIDIGELGFVTRPIEYD
jgi:hypothetical protein